MNNREIVRKWAPQSNASIWIWMLLYYLLLGRMIALFPSTRLDIVVYSQIPTFLFIVVSNNRNLAKEIVRLEEKIEELERRIP